MLKNKFYLKNKNYLYYKFTIYIKKYTCTANYFLLLTKFFMVLHYQNHKK